jgi:hypothetical protein
MFNLFKKNKKQPIAQEQEEITYSSICGIVEIIEFNKNSKEINGVLFDSEGREFEFEIKTNGDLIRLTGKEKDLGFSLQICVDYLKNKYGKNEINELRGEFDSKMQQLQFSIKKLNEDVENIQIPVQFVPLPESKPEVQEPINTFHTQVDEEPFEEETDENQLTFQDFSDEDISSHALKVLNGEISINA